MKKVFKFIMKVVALVAALFAGTFTVYMFNLDMKLMAFIQPYLAKVYDLRKRERKI